MGTILKSKFIREGEKWASNGTEGKGGRNSRINIRTMFVIHGEILFNRSREGATRSIYHSRETRG